MQPANTAFAASMPFVRIQAPTPQSTFAESGGQTPGAAAAASGASFSAPAAPAAWLQQPRAAGGIAANAGTPLANVSLASSGSSGSSDSPGSPAPSSNSSGISTDDSDDVNVIAHVDLFSGGGGGGGGARPAQAWDGHASIFDFAGNAAREEGQRAANDDGGNSCSSDDGDASSTDNDDEQGGGDDDDASNSQDSSSLLPEEADEARRLMENMIADITQRQAAAQDAAVKRIVADFKKHQEAGTAPLRGSFQEFVASRNAQRAAASAFFMSEVIPAGAPNNNNKAQATPAFEASGAEAAGFCPKDSFPTAPAPASGTASAAGGVAAEGTAFNRSLTNVLNRRPLAEIFAKPTAKPAAAETPQAPATPAEQATIARWCKLFATSTLALTAVRNPSVSGIVTSALELCQTSAPGQPAATTVTSIFDRYLNTITTLAPVLVDMWLTPHVAGEARMHVPALNSAVAAAVLALHAGPDGKQTNAPGTSMLDKVLPPSVATSTLALDGLSILALDATNAVNAQYKKLGIPSLLTRASDCVAGKGAQSSQPAATFPSPFSAFLRNLTQSYAQPSTATTPTLSFAVCPANAAPAPSTQDQIGTFPRSSTPRWVPPMGAAAGTPPAPGVKPPTGTPAHQLSAMFESLSGVAPNGGLGAKAPTPVPVPVPAAATQTGSGLTTLLSLLLGKMNDPVPGVKPAATAAVPELVVPALIRALMDPADGFKPSTVVPTVHPGMVMFARGIRHLLHFAASDKCLAFAEAEAWYNVLTGKATAEELSQALASVMIASLGTGSALHASVTEACKAARAQQEQQANANGDEYMTHNPVFVGRVDRFPEPAAAPGAATTHAGGSGGPQCPFLRAKGLTCTDVFPDGYSGTQCPFLSAQRVANPQYNATTPFSGGGPREATFTHNACPVHVQWMPHPAPAFARAQHYPCAFPPQQGWPSPYAPVAAAPGYSAQPLYAASDVQFAPHFARFV